MMFLKKFVRALFVLFILAWGHCLYAMPMPTTDLSDVPSSAFAGEEFCFDVNIANTGTVGFGPYLQIQLPAGVTFSSSEFLDNPSSANNVGTFALPDLELVDPLIGTTVSGPLDGNLIIIQPPIGSIVDGGPDLIVNVCATIDANAEIGAPLAITATPIFQLGDSATGNNGPVSGPTQTATVSPSIVEFEKRLIAPEGERPPGPSWPVTYELVADVANANTIFNLDFNDVLPSQLAYVSNSISVVGGTGCNASVIGQSIAVDCASAVGTSADEDVVVTYQAYVTDILDEAACTSDTITNTATFDAERFDSVTTSNIPITTISSQETLTTSNVEMQKSVSPGIAPNFVSPGDTLTYTVNIQTSEYGDVNNLIFNDLLPDGLENFQPVSVTGPSGALAVTPVVNPNADGSISVTYDIQAVSGNLPAASVITIVYTADIAQSFTTPVTPVKANDFLTNTAAIDYGFVAGASNCTDASSATATINPLKLTKEIINPQTEYQPGEIVTFRLTMSIPSGDTANIVFDDFFPLPVFDVDSLNLAFGTDITLASNDTLGLTPDSITKDSGANKLSITWPDVSTTGPQTLAVDIDIAVGTEPFSDNLSLSNLFQASTNNTPTPTAVVDLGLVGIKVGAPVLEITKGIESSTNANSTIETALIPNDSNLVDADAFDLITYEITVENVGGAPARDVVITDDLGMPISLLENCSVVSVENGSGTSLAYSQTMPFDGVITLTDQLEANDENPAGGGSPFSTDTAIAKISCEIDESVSPGDVITNTSSATWASAVGDTAFSAVSDDATVTIVDPEISKQLVGSDTTFTIGDIIRYEVVITVPELTLNNFIFRDRLDNGLAFVSFTDPANFDVISTAGITSDPSVFNINVSNTGRNLDMSFGTVTNTNSDDTTQTITVSYDVVVTNSAGINRGGTKNNRANIRSSEFNSADVEADDITILEPNVRITKSVIGATDNYDAGDIVTYQWRIRHTGNNLSDAFEVKIEDTLPPNVQFNNDITLTSGTCAGLTSDITNLPVIEANLPVLLTTDDCRYRYTVTLLSGVEAGTSLVNDADITWSTQLGNISGPLSEYNTNSCERTGSPDQLCGSDSVNDYNRSDDATIRIRNVAIQKFNLSTSEPGTDNGMFRPLTNDLAIGETATYRLRVQIPEGTSQQIIVTDNFPADADVVMEYVSVGTITIGSNLNVTNVSPTPVFSDSTLVDGINDTVLLDFGQVINTATDGVTDDDDRIYIEVTGRVVDIPKNASADESENSASVDFGVTTMPTTIRSFDIVEPLLEIDKSSPITTADGGDLVTYTIEIKHSAASSQQAFDAVVRDIVPSGLVYQLGTLQLNNTLPTASCSVSPVIDESNAATTGLTATFANLPISDVCILEFQARLDGTVNPNQIITNVSNLTWDSLSIDDDPNERNYSVNDDHKITVSNPGLSKIVFDTSEASTGTGINGPEPDLTIGERVTYRFTATIPEGQSNSVVISDQVPNSGVVLKLISSEIISIGGQLTLSSSIGDSGDDCLSVLPNGCDSNGDSDRDLAQWDLGTIVNTPDGSSDTNDQIVFEVIAVVTNSALNTGTDDDVVNMATLSFGAGQMVSSTALVDIVEPKLSIAKEATPAATPFLVDAGDVVTFEIEVKHDTDSNADAFNIQIVDTLANNGTDALMNWNGNFGGTCVGTTASTSVPFDLVFDVPNLDIASNSCTITYEVVVDTLATPAQTLQNSAAMVYDSTPVFVTDETRSSSDNTTANVVVTAPSMMLKDVTSSSLGDTGQSQHDTNLQDLTIGEEVTYTVSLKFPEGTTRNVVLTDVLPNGTDGVIELVGSPIINLGTKITTTSPIINTTSNGFTINFGTVTNIPDNNDTDGDFISVTLTGVVTDVAANIDAAQPINSATFSYTDGTGLNQKLTDTATVDIVEPEMNIDKSMTVNDGLATITVSLENTGTSSAYDILIEDVLNIANWDTSAITPITVPTGFTLSTVAGPNLTTETTVVMATDPSSNVPINSIEPNETITFVFTVPVQPSISSIANTATNTNSTTIPGGNPNERDEPDVASTATLLIPLIELEKTAAALTDTNGDGDVGGVGDDITYIFNVKNTGGVDLTNINVTDANSNVVITGNPISLLVGETDNSIRGTYEITQADMNLGTFTNTASVTADGPIGAGSTSDTSDDPTDTDETDANGDGEFDGPTVVTLPRNPLFNMEKTASPTSLSAPGVITYTFTFTNTGNIDLTNLALNDPDIDTNSLVCNGDTGSDGDTAGDGDIDSLAIDGVETCSAERTIDQDQINLGLAITNTATASATDLDGTTTVAEDPTLDDNSTSTPVYQNPSFNMVKTASPANISEPGNITYTFTFTNTGNVELTNLTVNDANIDSGTLVCTDGNQIDSLAVGAATKTCQATRFIDQTEINLGANLTNTATASVTGPDGTTPVTETDTTDNTTSTPVNQTPSFNMVKTASPANISAPGDITYTFTFTNTGNVALTNLGIIDGNIDQSTLVCSNDADSNNTIDVLAVGAGTQTCTATRPVTQAQINAGTALVNSATATASGPNGTGTVTEADTSDNNTSTPVIQSPSYNMVKAADPLEISEPGIITYTFEFTNTGNIDLLNLTVTDPDIDVGSLECEDDNNSNDDPTIDTDETIPVLIVGNDTKTCTAQRTITQTQINAGDDLVNTATPSVSVSYTQPNGDPVVVVEDETTDNTATTTIDQTPGYNMVKTASPASLSEPGDITYTFTFTNTGNVELTNLTVIDNNINAGSLVCQDDLDGDTEVNIDSLPVGNATKTCTATRTIDQTQINLGANLINTATASVTGPDGTTDIPESDTTDNSTSTPVYQNPSFNMVKTASPANISEPGNITYTFTFTNTGNVELTNLTVNDANIDSGTLVCTDGNQIDSLAVGAATKTCQATRFIDQTEINLGANLTNTATASVTGPDGTTPVTETDTTDNTTSTPVNQTPSFNMVKTASPANISAPGDITYTFTFTNTGNVALTNLGIIDGNIDQSTLVCSNDADSNNTIDVLAVGAGTQTCTATRPVTQAQINAGTALVNSATATASGPNGTGTVTEADTSDNNTSTPVIQSPSYNMVKAADPLEISEPGIITYTFEFTNTGNIDLLNLTVTDPDIDVGSLECEDDNNSNDDPTIDTDETIPVLIVGNDTKTCTAQRTITQTQINAGDDLVNTATPSVSVSYTQPNGDPVVVVEDETTDNTATTTIDQTPGYNMVKTASPASLSEPGDITYTFTFTNTGNVELTNLTVIDNNINAGSLVCQDDLDGDTEVNIDSLPVGNATKTCTATRTIDQTQINLGANLINTATASVTGPDGTTDIPESDTTDNSTSTPVYQNPSFNMVKTASPANISEPGNITYTFTFTNTGNVELTNLTVNDANIDSGTLVCTDGNQIDSLAVGAATKTCQATRFIDQTEINLGANLTNTATASVTGPDGTTPVTETDTTDNTTSTPVNQTPSFNMVKTASPANISAPGDITYTFTFTNTGNVALTNLGIIDGNIDQSTLVCSNDADSNNTIDVLAVGAGTQTCTATRPVTQAQINAGTALVNSATATASGPNGTGTVTEADTSDNNTSTPVIQSPSYNMVKAADPLEISEPGIITYTFEFTNTGNIDLLNLTVTDPDIDVGSLECEDDNNSNDDPTIDTDETIPVLIVGNDTKTCTAQRTITQTQINAGDDLVNTATPSVSVSYTQPNGDPVVVVEDETTDNTATTTIDQTPGYNMVKTASPASLSEPGDITYTFTFTNTGNVELTNLTVIDNNINAGSLVCQDDLDGDTEVNIDSLPVGNATKTCTATRTIDQTQINLGLALTNTAVPTVEGPIGVNIVETDTSDNTVSTPVNQSPGFDMVKTALPSSIFEPGIITYTFTFTNTGNTELTNLKVIDANIDTGSLICTDGMQIDSLPVGSDSKECSATRTVTQNQINLGIDLINTATANVKGPDGVSDVIELITENNSTSTPVTLNPSFNMVKTASPISISAPGIITYTFTFTNTGNVELMELGINDLNIDAGTLVCTNDNDENATIDSLAVGSVTQSCTAIRTVTQDQINLGLPLENTATTNALSPDGDGGFTSIAETDDSDNSTSTPIVTEASYNMVKTAEPSVITEAGEITYTFTFTNTGNVSLANLRVIDTDIDSGSLVCTDDSDNDLDIDELDIGEVKTCVATRAITNTQISSGDPIVNEATSEVETLSGAIIVSESSLIDNRVSTPVMRYQPETIPTLSEWMLMLLSLLLLTLGMNSKKQIIKRHPPTF